MADNNEQKKASKDQAPKIPSRRSEPIPPVRQGSVSQNIGEEATATLETTDAQNNIAETATTQAQDNAETVAQMPNQSGILRSSSYDNFERLRLDRFSSEESKISPLRTRQVERSVSFDSSVSFNTKEPKVSRPKRRGRKKSVKTENTSAVEQAQETQKTMKTLETQLQAMMPAAAQASTIGGVAQIAL